MLVAPGEPPETVFAGRDQEALRHSGTGRMIRHELDGTATLLASEGRPANLSTHTDGGSGVYQQAVPGFP
jgi:hypothetical protein